MRPRATPPRARLNALDVALAAWLGAWIAIGVLTATQVRALTDLSRTATTAGVAVERTGQTLRQARDRRELERLVADHHGPLRDGPLAEVRARRAVARLPLRELRQISADPCGGHPGRSRRRPGPRRARRRASGPGHGTAGGEGEQHRGDTLGPNQAMKAGVSASREFPSRRGHRARVPPPAGPRSIRSAGRRHRLSAGGRTTPDPARSGHGIGIAITADRGGRPRCHPSAIRPYASSAASTPRPRAAPA
jgi:hypothetical protein